MSRATKASAQDKSGCIIRNARFCNLSISYTDIAAKNEEKLGMHILIQGVYMLYRKVAYPWLELQRFKGW